MKTIISILSISIAVLFSSTAGYSQKMDLNGVTSIEVNIACQLILVQGSSPNIEIVGEKNAVANIETKISNGKLTITSDRKRQEKEDVVVKIEILDLKYLGIGGAVDMKTVRTLNLDEFEFSVSGVGNIEMALESNKFWLNGSGVTNLDITGKTKEMRMNISGVGNITATDFLAQTAKVNNSGVGKASVHVTESLEAEVSGIGTIYYSGNPIVNASVSGLGRIRRN